MAYRFISDTEKQEAAYTNLIDFLQSTGEPLKKEGNSYSWTGTGNNAVKIIPQKPHMFKDFYTGESGNAITFCKNYLGWTFQQAVEELTRGRFVNNPVFKTPTQKQAAKELYGICKREYVAKMPFEVPERSLNNNKLINYLANERGINREILDFFISKGMLYQTKEQTQKQKGTNFWFSNIAFICNDFNNNPVGAFKRGFPLKDNQGNTTNNGFKGDHKNTDKENYGFFHQGSGSGSLFVFEAPIDMLSYMSTIADAKGIQHALEQNYFAVGSTHTTSFVNLLQNKPHYDKIYLCQDNDKAGISARISAINAIEKLDYKKNFGSELKIISHFPQSKDWNEDLLTAVRSKDIISGDINSTGSLVQALNERIKPIVDEELKKAAVSQGLESLEPKREVKYGL